MSNWAVFVDHGLAALPPANAESLPESASPLLGIFPASQIQEPESALVFTATVTITTTGKQPGCLPASEQRRKLQRRLTLEC